MSDYQQPTNRVNQFFGGAAPGQPVPSQSLPAGPFPEQSSIPGPAPELGSLPDGLPLNIGASVVLPDVDLLFPPIPPELAATPITYGEARDSLRGAYQILASAIQSSVAQQDQFIKSMLGELMPSVLEALGESAKTSSLTTQHLQRISDFLLSREAERERAGGDEEDEE